jgi:tripeptidyl-peptidase-1
VSFADNLQYLLAIPNKDLPTVPSVSYSLIEDLIPPSMIDRLCSQYAQSGARGVSVIYVGGDSGPGDTCLTSNGTRRFTPIFPESCQFVTSVGGTAGIDPERAWSRSRGGFSHFFPRPAWQSARVNAFLKTTRRPMDWTVQPVEAGLIPTSLPGSAESPLSRIASGGTS